MLRDSGEMASDLGNNFEHRILYPAKPSRVPAWNRSMFETCLSATMIEVIRRYTHAKRVIKSATKCFIYDCQKGQMTDSIVREREKTKYTGKYETHPKSNVKGNLRD